MKVSLTRPLQARKSACVLDWSASDNSMQFFSVNGRVNDIKRCHKCQQQKPRDMYGCRIGKRHGRSQICKTCQNLEYARIQSLRIKIEFHTRKINRRAAGILIRIDGKAFSSAANYESAIVKVQKYCEERGVIDFDSDLFESTIYGYRATFKRQECLNS